MNRPNKAEWFLCKKLHEVAVLLLLLAASVSSAAEEKHQSDSLGLEELIPVGLVEVDLMTVGFPPRAVELNHKLQLSLSDNPDWFPRYIKEHAQPGEPLPYHPNMGLTEDEYAELLELFGEGKMVFDRRSQIEIASDAQGSYTIVAGDDLSAIDGLVIDLNTDSVDTPLGRADQRSDIVPNERQTTVGPFRAVEWALEQSNLDEEADPTRWEAVIVKITLGQIEESKRVILRYKANKIVEGAATVNVEYIMYFDPPRQP